MRRINVVNFSHWQFDGSRVVHSLPWTQRWLSASNATGFSCPVLAGLRFRDLNVFAAIAFGFVALVFDVLLFEEIAGRRAFSAGIFFFTVLTALVALLFVAAETNVLPFAAR